MTQTTDVEVREIKTAIESIAKATESNTKAITDLTQEMRLGFANVDKKLDVMDTRLIEVEKKIDKQDTRLWAVGGIVMTAALGIVVKFLALPDR
jgi:septation ring formation regulator EzrA